uniref:Mitochondrial ATP5e n=1 Tax=Mesenchytraeus solifugus TaxID=223748 RepID=A0A2L1DEY2_MESSO|nr:mitochondrial ATP5e [Mesenchytraeus solifugus]
MSSWRLAGLNYINYSRVCARVVRRALKADLRVDAMKRDEGFIRPIFWKDGKAIVIKKSPQQAAAEETAKA